MEITVNIWKAIDSDNYLLLKEFKVDNIHIPLLLNSYIHFDYVDGDKECSVSEKGIRRYNMDHGCYDIYVDAKGINAAGEIL
ncbi:MAG: hypothetical protein V3V00_15715 [Saprospiraceae bacterium]